MGLFSTEIQRTLLQYTPTPVIEINTPSLQEAGVAVFLKCEYSNHPTVAGNKWWKLKHNLHAAAQGGSKTLLTFGGAYSNHIYATAAAAHELGWRSIGVIRGERTLPLNPTLRFAEAHGMTLQYVPREQYKQKTSQPFLDKLHQTFGNFFLIPEGGSNAMAVRGVEEFAQTLDHRFDYYTAPVGTGGTLAGLIKGLPADKAILGFSSLKGDDTLSNDVRNLGATGGNWHIINDYHFGGYGKTTPELLGFIRGFYKQHGIPLDVVYTSKMMMGIYDLAAKGYFRKGSSLLAIHTGGLQGNTSMLPSSIATR